MGAGVVAVMMAVVVAMVMVMRCGGSRLQRRGKQEPGKQKFGHGDVSFVSDRHGRATPARPPTPFAV